METNTMKMTIIKDALLDDNVKPQKQTFDEDDATLIDRLVGIVESPEYEKIRHTDFGIYFEFDKEQNVGEAKEFFNKFAEKIAKRDRLPRFVSPALKIPGGAHFSVKKDEDHGYLLMYLKMKDVVVLLEPKTGKKILPLPSKYDPVERKKRREAYDPTGSWGGN
jgi:hypothetical protein